MEMIQGGLQSSFEATFDATGLSVAMSVYDVTAGAPGILVSGPTAMFNPAGYTYVGQFTPLVGKQYLILKAVYTDGTYTTLDPNHSQSTETVLGIDIGAIMLESFQPTNLIGYLDNLVPVPKQIVNLIQGSHENIIVRLIDPISGDPISLALATAVTTCFLNTDGSELMLGLGTGITIVGDANLGKLQISLTAAQTALLSVQKYLTLEITIVISGGDPIKVQIPQSYNVLQTVC